MIAGSAAPINSSIPNHLKVVLKVPIGASLFIYTNGVLDVWDTDYETYSLVYSCRPPGIEIAWILSRTKTLSQATISRLEALLTSKGVDANKFRLTQQTC